MPKRYPETAFHHLDKWMIFNLELKQAVQGEYNEATAHRAVSTLNEHEVNNGRHAIYVALPAA